jgi:tRNA 2-thiouridine synthesizing protein D
VKYTIIVYGAPYSSEGPHSAYNFTRAALRKGHQIQCIFFLNDGALNGSAIISKHEENFSLITGWQDISDSLDISMLLCVSSGSKKGVINQQQAKRLGISGSTIASGFEIAGLGALTEAIVRSDRVVTFGSAI